MMLKEYSGRPPPRISSRPGTPVGSCRMVTRSCRLILSLRAHESASILECYSSSDVSGQASRTSRSVRGSPMKVTSSPSRCAVIATAASTRVPYQRRAVQILPGSRQA